MSPEDILKRIQQHAEKSLALSLLDEVDTSEKIEAQ